MPESIICFMSHSETPAQVIAADPQGKEKFSLWNLLKPRKPATADNSVLEYYLGRTSFAFFASVLAHLVFVFFTALMIVATIVIILLPNPSDYQMYFGVGIFLTGSALMALLVVRSPAASMREYLRENTRIEVVLSSLKLETEVYRRELDKLQKKDTSASREQVNALLEQIQKSTEKAVAHLKPPDDLLE